MKKMIKYFIIWLFCIIIALPIFAQENTQNNLEPVNAELPATTNNTTQEQASPQQTTTQPATTQTPTTQIKPEQKLPQARIEQTQPIRQKQQQDALVLYQNGDYIGAISICENEIALDPTRIESYVVLCWSLVRNKQYAEAEQRAATALKISPYDLRLIEIYGEAKYYLGKNNGALEQFQKYVASAPESASRVGTAYYFMGEIYIKQARYQHADISLSAAVKKEPLLDVWWTRLGYAREMAGNYYESSQAYDEALLLNASSIEAKNGKQRINERLQ